MQLSTRVTAIKESPTFAVITKALQMQKKGMDVITLAAGEPDFDTPEHIKIAAIKAIIDGKTKYTPVSGLLELKEAIIRKFANDNQLFFAPNEIITSCGGKHVLFNILLATINPHDEVIIPAPYWVSYPDMVTLAGGTPVIIKCDIEQSFKLSATHLKQHISEKTRAIILNSPSNPTGMVYSKEELQELAQVFRQYPQLLIISDDIYEHILFAGQKFVNIANVAPDLLERIVVVNGVSKSYAMTGWRIGFAGCKNHLLIHAMDKIQSQSTSNPCSISQYAAIAALNSGIESIIPMRESFTLRHDYIVERLNKIRGVKCKPAQGAFYAFFDCRVAIQNMFAEGKIQEKTDFALANYILDNFLVAFVPGSAFGFEGFIRLSFATGMDDLVKALDRLSLALS